MIDEARVHPATPRRREEARRAGIIPRSADLTRSAAMLAAAVAVAFTIEPVGRAASAWMSGCLSSIGSVSADQAPGLLRRSMGSAALWLAPVLGAALLVAFVTHGLQTGFAWTPPSFRAGGRLPAGRGISVTAWGLLKFGVLVAIAAWTIHQRASSSPVSTATAFATGLGASVGSLVFRLSLAFLLFGLADYALARRRHEAELRMTSQEVRDEQRDSGADPRLRKQRRSLLKQWMGRG